MVTIAWAEGLGDWELDTFDLSEAVDQTVERIKEWYPPHPEKTQRIWYSIVMFDDEYEEEFQRYESVLVIKPKRPKRLHRR